MCETKQMRFSPKVVGLLQAAGLTFYIASFAALVQGAERWIRNPHPILGITLFLLAFVVSALISGSIVFAYPILLLFDGKKDEALRIVFWSAVWLILFFLLFGVIALIRPR
jgi:hypothetical protein